MTDKDTEKPIDPGVKQEIAHLPTKEAVELLQEQEGIDKPTAVNIVNQVHAEFHAPQQLMLPPDIDAIEKRNPGFTKGFTNEVLDGMKHQRKLSQNTFRADVVFTAIRIGVGASFGAGMLYLIYYLGSKGETAATITMILCATILMALIFGGSPNKAMDTVKSIGGNRAQEPEEEGAVPTPSKKPQKKKPKSQKRRRR